jgi:hypothetical protein
MAQHDRQADARAPPDMIIVFDDEFAHGAAP